MKSLTGKLSSGRGWALLLALLLGAGMVISACGEEDVPAPTTPAPPPTPPPAPEPEPTPEPPDTPTGLHVDEVTASSITWHWNAVEGAVGYVVQAGMDETWDDTDNVSFNGLPFTTETHYTASGLDPETTMYVRVASAAGTVEAPLVSDFSTHVTGMTTAVSLAPAPANLRVKGEPGPNYIEWEWDPVDGVAGYQSQFSASSDFPTGAAGREFHEGMNDTTRRVSNLASEADGYLRVRTYTGTQADPTYGMWSGGIMGTTAEPPPAAPLAAPDGLEVDARSDDSVTLVWDSVRHAGSYEVQQREPGDDWDDANCGEDGTVEEEECVASGLDSGTDYDFQVRAVPSDTDKYETSDWSDTLEARTEGTAPVEPTAPVGGGMGALNVRWTSDMTNIDWTWDRLADKTYDYVILTSASTGGLPRMDAANPCAGVDYPDATTASSATNARESTNSPALLCVKTTNTRDSMENLSFAWAVRATLDADRPTLGAASPATDSSKATRSLTWGGIRVEGGFSYEIKTIADPERDNRIIPTSPTDGALQRACAAGDLLESDETDVTLTGLETTLTSVKPYTGYLLCLRMLNSSGATDWVVPASNAEHYTVPAQAPRPTKDGRRSEDDRDATSERIVWNVASRNNLNVPRGDGTFTDHYNVKVIWHPDRNDGDDTDDLHDDRVTRPTAATCGDADFSSSPYDDSTTITPALTSGGFTLTATIDRSTTPVKTGVSQGNDVNTILSRIATLCIQAKHGTRLGPWNASPAETIERRADQN